MPEELFDFVDADDNVIGQAPRNEVHARRLLHRAVHVFLFKPCGELLLQMRSASKDEYPLTYTSSASGHVDAGETYDHAALRELQEELALVAPLEYLAKIPASAETANEHSVLYRAVSEKEPIFHPGEIESIKFFSINEIRQMIRSDPNLFAPPFRKLFGWYLEFRLGN